MGAADYAAMSDPDRNPHFRRRWTDESMHRLRPAPKPEPDCHEEPNGLVMALRWRQEWRQTRRDMAEAR